MSIKNWGYSLKDVSRKTIDVYEPTKRKVVNIYDDKGTIAKTVEIKPIEEGSRIGFKVGDDI